MAGVSSDPPPIELKVMRLTQPKTSLSVWHPLEDWVRGLTQKNLAPSNTADTALGVLEVLLANEDFALQLPTQQGRVFAGEAFSAHINVLNSSTSSATLSGVKLLVELSNASGGFVLYDSRLDPVLYLKPEEGLDVHVSQHLQTVGEQILSCQVFYTLAPSTTAFSSALSVHDPPVSQVLPFERSFKRTYRFLAEEPFEIAHRIQYWSQTEGAVECCLTNRTLGTVYLQSVDLVPAVGFQCQRVSGFKEERHHHSTDSAGIPEVIRSGTSESLQSTQAVLLNNDESLSVAFSVLRNPQLQQPAEAAEALVLQKDVSQGLRRDILGRLALRWYIASGGGAGYLDRHVLMDQPRTKRGLTLRVSSCPASVHVEEAFHVVLECHNGFARSVSPVVKLTPHTMKPFCAIGPLTRKLELLEAQCQTRFELQLVALERGLHALRGIHIEDFNDAKVIDAPKHLQAVRVD